MLVTQCRLVVDATSSQPHRVTNGRRTNSPRARLLTERRADGYNKLFRAVLVHILMDKSRKNTVGLSVSMESPNLIGRQSAIPLQACP